MYDDKILETIGSEIRLTMLDKLSKIKLHPIKDHLIWPSIIAPYCTYSKSYRTQFHISKNQWVGMAVMRGKEFNGVTRLRSGGPIFPEAIWKKKYIPEDALAVGIHSSDHRDFYEDEVFCDIANPNFFDKIYALIEHQVREMYEHQNY